MICLRHQLLRPGAQSSNADFPTDGNVCYRFNVPTLNVKANGIHELCALLQLEIYANATDLGTLAERIREVPGRKTEALWELGSELLQDRFAFYLRLRAHQIAPMGQCAVEVRLNNNAAPPDREVTEFSIHALPADLDRFADLLEEFGRLEHRQLRWSVTSGELLK